MLTVLHLLFQDVKACIDLEYVKKIIPLAKLEKIPGQASYIAGLLNLEGKSILVCDLGLRLNFPRTESYSLQTPIVICRSNNHLTGLIIDKILGLEEIDEATFQIPEDFSKPDSPFTAIVPIKEQLSLLLNIKNILYTMN